MNPVPLFLGVITREEAPGVDSAIELDGVVWSDLEFRAVIHDREAVAVADLEPGGLSAGPDLTGESGDVGPPIGELLFELLLCDHSPATVSERTHMTRRRIIDRGATHPEAPVLVLGPVFDHGDAPPDRFLFLFASSHLALDPEYQAATQRSPSRISTRPPAHAFRVRS